MFKNKSLIAIFLLALFLRTYKLGTHPIGFHADEARAGWNAYSILKTGLDDRGNQFALYYNTFGDYRPTGIIYLTIPSLIIFGLNEFAVRFPSALIGALTIFPLFLFTKEITKKNKVAITASLLLALSPWHISTSRGTSEVIISILFALFGLYYFQKAISDKKPNIRTFTISFLLLSFSYFFYHSIRLLAPLFVLTLITTQIKNIISHHSLKHSAILAFSLIALTGLMATQSEARGRFSQVSIFSDLDVKYELSRMPFEEGPNKIFQARLFHNKPLTYSRKFINEYTKYFSANFLISDIAKPSRYATVGIGLMTYIELALFIFGLISIAQKKSSFLPLALLLVSPFPAALTTEDSPNLHRALFMIIYIVIIEAYGLIFISQISQKYREKLVTLCFTLLILNFTFYLHMYYVHAPYQIANGRSYGTKELALKLNELESSYDQIILTNIPDDIYPWLAFFGRKDPAIFNKDAIQREHGNWSYKNFHFTSQRCPSRDAFESPEVKKLLVVDARGCAEESNLLIRDDVKILSQIKEPNESIIYTLWSRIED